jgi:hypothetical protein
MSALIVARLPVPPASGGILLGAPWVERVNAVPGGLSLTRCIDMPDRQVVDIDWDKYAVAE